jgi:hypothetical protein
VSPPLKSTGFLSVPRLSRGSFSLGTTRNDESTIQQSITLSSVSEEETSEVEETKMNQNPEEDDEQYYYEYYSDY